MSARQHTINASHRRSVTSRTLAAVVGGYTLTSLLTLAVPLLFSAASLSLAQTLHATTMAGFLVYAGIVIAVFHARSATRAWAWLAFASVLSGIVAMLLMPATIP